MKETTGAPAGGKRFIVSIDLRENNGAVFPMCTGNPQVQARFQSLSVIRRLKAQHILGGLPWIVTDIDTAKSQRIE